MSDTSAFTQFQTGLKRFPFHTITLSLLLIVGTQGYVPADQIRVLMSILAGVMLSPFYNGFASLMYDTTDKGLVFLSKKIPEWFKQIVHVTVGYCLTAVAVVSISKNGYLDIASIYLMVMTFMIWVSISFEILYQNGNT